MSIPFCEFFGKIEKMEFKDKLIELMHEKNINQRQLSIHAKIPTTTISGWVNLNRLPDFTALKKLSTYFCVSIDYLAGNEDEFGNKIYQSNFNIKKNSYLEEINSNLTKIGKAKLESYAEGLLASENADLLLKIKNQENN